MKNNGLNIAGLRIYLKSKRLIGFYAAAWVFCGVFCLTAASCRRTVEKAREKIRIEQVERIDPHGTGGCDVVLQVRNDTGYKLRLESASIDLYYGSSRVVTVLLQEPVEVPRHRVQSVVTRWKWRIGDPLALYALFRRVQRDDTSGIAVSYAAAGRGGPASFAVGREQVPLNDMLNALGVELREIKDYFKFR